MPHTRILVNVENEKYCILTTIIVWLLMEAKEKIVIIGIMIILIITGVLATIIISIISSICIFY